MSHYRVYCDKCGYTEEETGQSTTFHSYFFWSKRCKQCGDKKDEHPNCYGKWNVSYGDWKRYIPFKLFKPSTWLSPIWWVPFEEKEDK